MSFQYNVYDERDKLKLENINLNASREFYVKQSKRFEDETKELKEEIQSLKTSKEDLLKHITALSVFTEKKEKEEKKLKLNVENKTKMLKEEVQVLKTSNEGLLKQITELNSDKEIKETEEKNLKLIKETEENNLKLIEKVSELQQKIESERIRASKKDSDFSKLTSEKNDLELKCADLHQKISKLEKIISATKTDLKSTELQCVTLIHQVSDFEVLLFQEKEKQEKERKDSEEMRKKAEKKHSTVLKELSDKKKASEQRFEEERRLFKTEIMKLTKKLADLSTAAMRNRILKSKNPAEFDSFKTTSSSRQSTGSYNKSDSSSSIRSSNIFFDKNVDRSGTWKKKDKCVWRKKENDQKTVVPNFNVKKNNASNGKFVDKSKHTYTKDQMLSLSRRKFYCSYCHTHSFNHKSSDHFWYDSYSVIPTRTATNMSGPKYKWVPKTKSNSVLQAPQSNLGKQNPDLHRDHLWKTSSHSPGYHGEIGCLIQ